ncbi:hypothetical protein HYU07_03320 [Candidatus Woesearchaeota archaeon]|nr:hypothetical protein [Candidatus Woesearchaeota archaeon]
MALNAEVIKELEYPLVMDWKLVEKWADKIPIFSENDPKNPEWKATPVKQLEGCENVFVKDESDIRSNPTQTIKDRMAWELTALFRDYARGLYLKKKSGLVNGNIGSLVVPRLTYVTAGNVGRSVSNMFEKFELPPMKLLVDSYILTERLETLKGLHADIYRADLSKKPLTAGDIKRLTNNENGIDITSVMIIEPNAVFYDWHVHEAFNECPDEIYVPYGSGRLMENYLTWQTRNARNKDPRLKIPLEKLTGISILGAEPEQKRSIADKLTKNYNPFIIFDDQDFLALKTLEFTGKNTGVFKVSEERIKQAYQILSQYCNTEPSAAAGLALYLQRFDEGKINPRNKALIINTGKGI